MPANPKSALDLAHEAIDRLCTNADHMLPHQPAPCSVCKEAHAALEEAVRGMKNALTEIRLSMGGECGSAGWESPEDVWRIADAALKKGAPDAD